MNYCMTINNLRYYDKQKGLQTLVCSTNTISTKQWRSNVYLKLQHDAKTAYKSIKTTLYSLVVFW